MRGANWIIIKNEDGLTSFLHQRLATCSSKTALFQVCKLSLVKINNHILFPSNENPSSLLLSLVFTSAFLLGEDNLWTQADSVVCLGGDTSGLAHVRNLFFTLTYPKPFPPPLSLQLQLCCPWLCQCCLPVYFALCVGILGEWGSIFCLWPWGERVKNKNAYIILE